MNQSLTDIEFKNVCELIANYLGLDFLNEKSQNLSRILSAASRDFGFQNLSSFVGWLLSAEVKRDQIEILASYLTNSETYFWREPMVFNSLSQSIIKDLIGSKKNGERKLNIWCAGCSTGEEAYSLAISIHKAVSKIEDWNISIIATDINSKSLVKARLGVYGSWSFRNSPSWLKERYFEKAGDNQYKIIPAIKDMVVFSDFNLTSENYLSTVCKNRKMDIIFCRNVLMYFSKEWASKASDKFYNSLSDDGWFAVSSCELSNDLFSRFKSVNFPGAVLYHKSNVIENQPVYSLPLIIPGIISEVIYSPLLPVSPSPIHSEEIVEWMPEEILNDNLITIRSLADKGLLEEALQICNEAIESEKLAPALYFMRASILQELNNSNDAIKSLKQAIFIDPEYIMGHFTLGNIFIRQGIIKNAERYFKNALDLLNSVSDDSIPAGSDGFSAQYLRRIILDTLPAQETI